MSMLSKQCNKLRKLASEIQALQTANSNWLWKDGAKLVDAVNALREAADTIEGLRDRLQVGGKLTAEQVREAIEHHGIASLGCRWQFIDRSYEAIADELNEKWNRRAAVTDEQFAWAVHDGRTWVCVERALESDELKPIEGFTRDSIYRDSMREHGEWMEKATALMRDIWSAYSAKAEESFHPVWEVDSDLAERLREFGIEV